MINLHPSGWHFLKHKFYLWILEDRVKWSNLV
jgi:hypothetical protein